MSDARTADGFDRLPWLADEPKPRTKRGPRELAMWAGAAMLVVAGASYWMGAHSSTEPVGAPSRQVPVSTTVPLPEMRQPEVVPDRVPEVVIAPAPTVRSAPEPEVRVRRSQARPVSKRVAAPAKSAPAPAAALPLSPSTRRVGPAGRMVRIGAFGTRLQAKRGWWAMVRAYPGLKPLRTVVVESRNSKGRHFYRLQIGTTSQAHSEVLCQRMQKIRYSCAVVGLPWKPGGVER